MLISRYDIGQLQGELILLEVNAFTGLLSSAQLARWLQRFHIGGCGVSRLDLLTRR